MQSNQRGRPLPVAGLATVAKRNREEQEEEEEHNTTTATTRGERHVEVSARNVDVTLMPVCVCVCGCVSGRVLGRVEADRTLEKGRKISSRRPFRSSYVTDPYRTLHHITARFLGNCSAAVVPTKKNDTKQKKTTTTHTRYATVSLGFVFC